MVLWRISNHVSLAGDGALRASGRWHTRGKRVVYCAQSPATALLEILVHFEIDLQDLPTRYRLLKIEAPDDIPVERVSFEHLPTDWPEKTEVTRAIGDAWLTKGSTPLLIVPSAILPETFNALLHPARRDAKRIVIAKITARHSRNQTPRCDQDPVSLVTLTRWQYLSERQIQRVSVTEHAIDPRLLK